MALARFCLQAGVAVAAGPGAVGAAASVRTSAELSGPVRCSTVIGRGAERTAAAGWAGAGCARVFARMQSGAMNGQKELPQAAKASCCRSPLASAARLSSAAGCRMNSTSRNVSLSRGNRVATLVAGVSSLRRAAS
jgi:hypothetical protein